MDEFSEVLWMLLSAVGGLGIFLLGMKNMSEGMQTVAGNSLRRMITAVTDNRLMAVGVGTGFTCLVQSSTVTTVIVVGLVNAGFMALHQAVGVIIGANIGTTITGWILVLKVGKYGLPMLGVAALFFLFSKSDRWRYVAMTVMGLGMAFFGLELMKNGFDPMKDQAWFSEAMTWFDATSYSGVLMSVLMGCVLTFLVQSSSATLAITIGLAATGAIPFATAAALVLGENIGTTITAWLASLGANTNAKRAAWAHIIFNVLGAIWVIAIFFWYVPMVDQVVEWVYGRDPMKATVADFEGPGAVGDEPSDAAKLAYASFITAAIASVHTGFNITNTLLFLPFVRMFSRALERVIPEKGREIPHLKHLDARVVDTPALAIAQSHQEVIQMGQGVVKMLDWSRQIALDGEEESAEMRALIKKVFHREEVLDAIEREILVFMTEVLDGSVPHGVSEAAREQLRITHEYESMADVVAAILKTYLKLRDEKRTLSKRQLEALVLVHDQVSDYVRMVVEAHEQGRADAVVHAHTMSTEITRRIKRLRDDHLQEFSDVRVDPMLTLGYTTLLTQYRRLKEHALNVAEALAGGKPVHHAGG